MPTHAAVCTRRVSISIVYLGFVTVASAQAPLLSARQALKQIVEQPLPACDNALQFVASKKDDATFLFNKFRDAGWGTVAKQYVLSLNDLADGLRRAATRGATPASCATISGIAADLHANRKDCQKLGHSRTDIPVEISTTQGKSAVSGLEVYVRWIPAGDHFDTDPKRLREFSSPARGTVPIPGEFEVFAKDPSTGKSTEPERVSIGGAEVFRWQLKVRFPDLDQAKQ